MDAAVQPEVSCSEPHEEMSLSEEAARDAALNEIAQRLKIIGDQVDSEMRRKSFGQSSRPYPGFYLKSGHVSFWMLFLDLLKLSLNQRMLTLPLHDDVLSAGRSTETSHSHAGPVSDSVVHSTSHMLSSLTSHAKKLPWSHIVWQIWASPGAEMTSHSHQYTSHLQVCRSG